MAKRKGRESKCQFDFRPLKITNRPELLMCSWHVTYCWKALDKGYNFSLDLTSIKPCTKHYEPPKSWKSQFQEFQDSQVGSPGTKWHLGAGLVAKHREYYKGKVVVSPKSGPWWVLCVHVCLWFVCAPKVLQLCINQLVWFLQVYLNNWPVYHSS
jgi:hypothetical protein